MASSASRSRQYCERVLEVALFDDDDAALTKWCEPVWVQQVSTAGIAQQAQRAQHKTYTTDLQPFVQETTHKFQWPNSSQVLALCLRLHAEVVPYSDLEEVQAWLLYIKQSFKDHGGDSDAYASCVQSVQQCITRLRQGSRGTPTVKPTVRPAPALAAFTSSTSRVPLSPYDADIGPNLLGGRVRENQREAFHALRQQYVQPNATRPPNAAMAAALRAEHDTFVALRQVIYDMCQVGCRMHAMHCSADVCAHVHVSD